MLEHLSVSQLDMFFRCGEQYRRRYLEGEKIPPGISARIGTGVHKAAEVNSIAKIRTGEDMPLDSVQDCAAEAYDKALREGVFFAPDEVSGARKAMAEGKDSAVALATLYRKELAPTLNPKFVEEKIYLDLETVPLPVLTVLDLYTEDEALHDLKTSSKKWTDDKARSSNQPTAYREAIRQATGSYPQEILFDVLVNNKKPILQTLSTNRTQADTIILAKKFNLMLAAIKAGIFHPAEAGSWACSPKFCGYWFTCPYIPEHKKVLPK